MQTLEQASPEEIAAFKKSSAARYAERGIDPAKATELFDGQMKKLSEQVAAEQSAEVTKQARDQRIFKIATEIAQSVGRTRPAAV